MEGKAMQSPDDGFVWFVDFDGVVCTTRANMAHGRHDDPVAFGLLARIVRDTKARIVVSSTRRGKADMEMPNNCRVMLARHGLFTSLHADWRTGQLNSRSAEIEDWLERNGRRPYGILDDERNDFTPAQLQRLIHTDMEFGLGARDVGRARRLAATPMGHDRGSDRDDDGDYQTPRLTLASQASAALAALAEGDENGARSLLRTIAEHPLAQ
jgi:hypothetical protein